MTQFSVELKILLDAVSWQINQVSAPNALPVFDESLLFKLAFRHNLLPWLLPYANTFSIGSEALRSGITSNLLKAGIKSQLQTLELVKLSKLLNSNDIEHVILKGITIEKRFYRGFVDSRYSDDIDILVSPRSLGMVTSLLKAADYHQRERYDLDKLASFLEKHDQWFRWRDVGFQKQSMGRECVDLHWRLADKFTIPVKTVDLLASVERIVVDGEQIPSLTFAALFVHVCVHGYIDYFFRLRYLVDVYSAMQQAEFDLNNVLEIAEDWGVTYQVKASMVTAERFFSGKEKRENNEQLRPLHLYSEIVSQRFVDANGLPKRSHPNHQKWTAKDKRQHLLNQIRFRSDRSFIGSPLLARCKYNHEMVNHWSPKTSALWGYPFVLLKRLLNLG